MKVLILNKKRIIVTTIVVVLIFILIGAAKIFEQRLKMTALIQNDINELKQYYVLNGKYKYKLPSNWKTIERKFSGNEIIYHNDFASNDGVISGNVQVWNLHGNLKTFLENSKNSSYNPSKYKNYKLWSIKIKNNNAYLLTYTVISSSNEKNVKAYEYFIDDKDKFFRMSFYVMEYNLKENMPTIFENIVNTYEKS